MASRRNHGFQWFHAFSLRAGLATAFITMIVLTLFVGFVSLLTQDRAIRALDRLLEVDGRIAALSSESNVAMLKARRAEKDFLLFRREFGFGEAKSRYATLLRISLAEIRQNMAEIRALNSDPRTVEQTQAVERAVSQYEAGFLRVVDLYGALGYVDSGFEGEIREAAHRIESIVNAAGEVRLLADLLSLRRHEKDFIARGLDKHAEAFAKGIDHLKTDLADARLSSQRKQELPGLADEYARLFEQYVRTNTRIDAETATYLAAAHTVEPVLDNLRVAARRSEIATRSEVEQVTQVAIWAISGTGLFAVLLGLAVAWFVARTISRSVDESLDFAKQVARGDFTARLIPRGRNEFGTLAVALNEMTAALQQRDRGLRRAQDVAKLSHVITGPDGAFESWSESLPELIGVVPEQMPRSTRAWLDLLHPDDRALFRGKAIEAGVKGAGIHIEYRLRRADGALIHVRQTMEPLEGSADAAGKSRWFNTLQDVTEQKRAAEALQLSEARYRAMFEKAGAGIAHTDLSGRYIVVNPKYSEITGYDQKDLRSLRFADLNYPEDVQRGIDLRAQLLAGTIPSYERELRMIRKDGKQIWASATTALILDAEGKPAHFISVLHDVSERKRAESALKESEAQYRDLIERASDGIFLCDAEGRYALVNARFADMLAYREEELLGLHFTVTYPGGERKLAAERSATVRESGGALFERLMCRRDGSLFPVEISLRPLRQGMVQGIVRDISERQKAQQALAESEMRFRQLAENINEVFFLMDPAGTRILYVSPTYEKIWGRSVAGLYENPRSWTDAIHPEDRSQAMATFDATARTGQFDFEFRIAATDGTLRWIRARGFPVRDDQGNLYRVAGVAEDITERRLQHRKIERLNRVYAVLSGINAAIVRTRERAELFREACRIAVEIGGFRFAWVCVVDAPAMQLQPVASAGADDGFLATVRQRFSLREDAPEGQGIAVTAVRERRAVIINDVQADSQIRYKQEHAERGIRSVAVLPLLVAGEARAVLALHSSEAGFFDDDEAKLLLELAGDIAFAMDHIEKAERLDYLAYYDSLTGLANRRLFLERLDQSIHAAAQTQGKLAVVLADIERLRTVNESLGRQAGDELLKQAAERLAHAAGASVVGRIGADQFAIVLLSVKGKSEVGRTVAKLSRSCFGEPFRLGGAELRISAKGGIALFPSDGDDAEALLRNAEAALVRAKESGEKYLFYSQKLTERVAERLTLENRLRQALERNEFVLHYQPKVELETRRIVGAEALIRWQSPELGLVPPGQFIPLMEETGLILEVGEWALGKAIADHSRWLEQGLRAPRLAVNVSAIQLRREDFVAGVSRALGRGATPPGIDLEITESLVMDEIERNIQKLKEIHDLGVDIAIDDFGTGYSSLGYLAKLPVQSLKIDRSFIITMLNDPDTLTLVRTMISLAQSLRLKVVAEGVDSEEQARFLRLLRCDQMQGYLFSRPLPFDDMTALLRLGQG